MLIVDIDKLFKSFATEYIKENKEKINGGEDDAESLYTAFQNTHFATLNGKTPLTFYQDCDDLIAVLLEHFNQNVPVSDYLIEALMHHGDEDRLTELLSDDKPEDLLLILIEVLSHQNSKKCVNRLIALLFSQNCSEKVKDSCAEYLEDFDVLDQLLSYCENQKANPSACYLLSKQKQNSTVSKILQTEFLNNLDRAQEYASYLENYGDESAVEILQKGLTMVNDYVSFKEISIAIEALGGTVSEKRDFTTDKNYIKIHEASKNEHKTDNK